MKFVARLMIFMSLLVAVSLQAGVIVGGGGMSKTRLQYTSHALKTSSSQEVTVLPASAKQTEKESAIPENLLFVPDHEFSDLSDVTEIHITDDQGKVLKTFSVHKVDEMVDALVLVEVTRP